MGMVTDVPHRDWSYTIDFPDEGWVWAPADDVDVAAWAQQVCDGLYAEGEMAVGLADQLRSFAVTHREADRDAGALWIPDVQYGVLAALFTETLVADPSEDLSVELVERLEAGMDDDRLAPAQRSVVDLPAGRAVRTRRTELSGHVFGNQRVAELVSHVVVPDPPVLVDRRPAALRHVVTWQDLTHGDDLADLADDCAALLSLTRSAD